MQETAGVEIAGSGGVEQLPQSEDADVPALVTAQHHGAVPPRVMATIEQQLLTWSRAIARSAVS